MIESDDDDNLIIAELKTSSKRYADSQGENQLDGLIYAYPMNQLGFRTTNAETLICYDVLVKTKSPAFPQIYFNKSPQDYGRLAQCIPEGSGDRPRRLLSELRLGLPHLPVSFTLLVHVTEDSLPF